MKFILAFFVIITFPLARAASTKVPPISAGEQAQGSRSDVEMTRKIREQLMKDDSLSVYAENVTVVTLGSKVTLRGEVTSKTEGERIATIARSVAGMKNVDNQLVYRK